MNERIGATSSFYDGKWEKMGRRNVYERLLKRNKLRLRV